jgi:acyl-CoA dehydrogenase
MSNFRKKFLSKPIFKLARQALPKLSDTEREALTAGDVWWDGDLFSGKPDWPKLLETPAGQLSAKEQAFLDGPVKELCRRLDDWEINRTRGDLPGPVWEFLKQEKFFAMIIPKRYGGLEFSAYAHSEVVRHIASRSLVAAVTVMVPNSLGPGELLLQYGTDAQRDHWLPRLADGRELPCFALTSTEAGSDAAAMQDRGIVCNSTYHGEDVLGIRLTWSKRYITLGPVATVLGLAFKLFDPDHLLGEQEELGITLALVPTALDGISIGARHIPAFQMFQNGPNSGQEVFIPLDHIIGGRAQIGRGWPMLMGALAAGRGISLPPLSSAATAFTARTTGAYARVREQFGIPIGRFEGIQERLAELAANAYLMDAARRLTCAGLDAGHKPSVISAIMKVHATERMRESIDHAMDIHGGKAVIDGPLNYLGALYRAVPVGITVEGANILTRSMIIFGQGAIRCHPWVLQEMLALEEKDPEKALDTFDASFWGHVKHAVKTFGRTWLGSWSGGRVGAAPPQSKAKRYYRQLNRYTAAFALLADVTLALLGGGLKRKEMLSGRLGDLLAELYLLSAVLKRWQDDAQPETDRPLLDYVMARGFATIENRLHGVLANLPLRPVAWLVRPFLLPLGVRRHGPKDALTRQCAEILLSPSETRDRLTAGLFLEEGANPSVAELEQAFDLVMETESLRKRLKDAGCKNRAEAAARGLLSADEANLLRRTEEAVARVVAVDDFPAEDLGESNFVANPDS